MDFKITVSNHEDALAAVAIFDFAADYFGRPAAATPASLPNPAPVSDIPAQVAAMMDAAVRPDVAQITHYEGKFTPTDARAAEAALLAETVAPKTRGRPKKDKAPVIDETPVTEPTAEPEWIAVESATLDGLLGGTSVVAGVLEVPDETPLAAVAVASGFDLSADLLGDPEPAPAPVTSNTVVMDMDLDALLSGTTTFDEPYGDLDHAALYAEFRNRIQVLGATFLREVMAPTGLKSVSDLTDEQLRKAITKADAEIVKAS